MTVPIDVFQEICEYNEAFASKVGRRAWIKSVPPAIAGGADLEPTPPGGK